MGAVENRRTIVKFPADIGVGDVVQIVTVTTAAGCRVDGTGVCVTELRRQAVAHVGMQVNLQRVVTPIGAVFGQANGVIATERNQLIVVLPEETARGCKGRESINRHQIGFRPVVLMAVLVTDIRQGQNRSCAE